MGAVGRSTFHAESGSLPQPSRNLAPFNPSEVNMNGAAVLQLPVSARVPDRFTPSVAAGEDNPPVYIIAIPTVMAKAQWQRRLAQTGASYASDAALIEALRDGIAAVVAEDQRAELNAILDRREELTAEIIAMPPPEEGDDTKADLRAAASAELAEVLKRVAEIERVISRAYEPYRNMVADRGYWMTVAPVLAARHFLAGWENVPVRFRRDSDGLVSQDALDDLPEGHLMAIGWRAITLMNAGTVAKN